MREVSCFLRPFLRFLVRISRRSLSNPKEPWTTVTTMTHLTVTIVTQLSLLLMINLFPSIFISPRTCCWGRRFASFGRGRHGGRNQRIVNNLGIFFGCPKGRTRSLAHPAYKLDILLLQIIYVFAPRSCFRLRCLNRYKTVY